MNASGFAANKPLIESMKRRCITQLHFRPRRPNAPRAAQDQYMFNELPDGVEPVGAEASTEAMEA